MNTTFARPIPRRNNIAAKAIASMMVIAMAVIWTIGILNINLSHTKVELSREPAPVHTVVSSDTEECVVILSNAMKYTVIPGRTEEKVEISEAESEKDEFIDYETYVYNQLFSESDGLTAHNWFVADEVLPEARVSEYGPGAMFFYNLTFEEIKMIAQVIWHEARAEPLSGQVAVGATVLNRWYNSNGKTLEQIITKPNQFAHGYVSDEVLAETTCMEAAIEAAMGWDPTRSACPNGGTMYNRHQPWGVYTVGTWVDENAQRLYINNHVFHTDVTRFDNY